MLRVKGNPVLSLRTKLLFASCGVVFLVGCGHGQRIRALEAQLAEHERTQKHLELFLDGNGYRGQARQVSFYQELRNNDTHQQGLFDRVRSLEDRVQSAEHRIGNLEQ